jgi:hypothetical protein
MDTEHGRNTSNDQVCHCLRTFGHVASSAASLCEWPCSKRQRNRTRRGVSCSLRALLRLSLPMAIELDSIEAVESERWRREGARTAWHQAHRLTGGVGDLDLLRPPFIPRDRRKGDRSIFQCIQQWSIETRGCSAG